MFNFFNRKTQNTPPLQKDEIVRLWENDLDDGSGLHAIWGYAYKFNDDNTGIYYTWSEQKLDGEMQFKWRRTGDKSIQAKFDDEDDWDLLEYTLTIVDGPYGSRLLKLTDNNESATDLSIYNFWHGFAPVFVHL